MAGEDIAEERPARRPRRWLSGAAKGAVGLIVALLVALAALIGFLDTDAGHRFIADRIAALSPSSGLKIRVGRIEGSIWGDTLLRDVRLYDPQGLFAESPLIELDWRPTGWLTNRLIVDDLASKLVIVHRLPKLVPSDEPMSMADVDLSAPRDSAALRCDCTAAWCVRASTHDSSRSVSIVSSRSGSLTSP